jgi:hypothetical protein
MSYYPLQFWSSAYDSAMHSDLCLQSNRDSPGEATDDTLLEGFEKAGRYALLLHAFDQIHPEAGGPSRPERPYPDGSPYR